MKTEFTLLERKKNSVYEKEMEKLRQENASLRHKFAEAEHNAQRQHEDQNSTRRLSQKEEEIEKLKNELRRTIEGSRLISEHSNRIISENTKYKEETDHFVSTKAILF